MSRHRAETRRSRAAVALVVAALLVSVGVACDAGGPVPSPGEGSRVEIETASPGTPAFRFVVRSRGIETTTRRNLATRDRRAARGTLDVVRGLVTDLYVAGFLDPEAWRTGTYDGVLAVFAGGARAEAGRRLGALTAGRDAGVRFTAIEPAGGSLWLRVLVDRSGAASLVSTTVRFRARAEGDPPTVLSSEGTYLFRRTGEGWRIVSFQVARRDRARDPA